LFEAEYSRYYMTYHLIPENDDCERGIKMIIFAIFRKIK